jgi:hypothetical protein
MTVFTPGSPIDEEWTMARKTISNRMIIDTAREFIANRENWTTHVYARDINRDEVDVISHDATCFCASGSLARAAYEAGAVYFGVAAGKARASLERGRSEPLSHINDELGHKAVLNIFDEWLANHPPE